MFGRTKSLDRNIGAQVFTNKDFFCTEYLTESKNIRRNSLKTFCTEFCVPEMLTFDNTKD